MTAPANTGAPLRRARISLESLASAFSAMAAAGVNPDLRADAYGLGIERTSQLARDAGLTTARHSAADLDRSALDQVPEGEPRSCAWLSGADAPVTLEASVISIKRVPTGTPVSYGYHYRTTNDTTLALISVGFADGVPRTASMKAEVALGGQTHRVAGRIAMDQLVLDIGDTPTTLGDVATIWGHSPTLAQWSTWSQRPAELLISHLAPRVVRTWE